MQVNEDEHLLHVGNDLPTLVADVHLMLRDADVVAPSQSLLGNLAAAELVAHIPAESDRLLCRPLGFQFLPRLVVPLVTKMTRLLSIIS